jgi:heme-degrading monooxygenase HmoA
MRPEKRAESKLRKWVYGDSLGQRKVRLCTGELECAAKKENGFELRQFEKYSVVTINRAKVKKEPHIAKTPEPPYYAVIFTAQRTEGDRGYGEMARRMEDLAAEQPGFLGAESVRGADGLGITVSYWASEEAIRNWKMHLEHAKAQEAGKRVWYSEYQVRVAKVEREYGKISGESTLR